MATTTSAQAARPRPVCVAIKENHNVSCGWRAAVYYRQPRGTMASGQQSSLSPGQDHQQCSKGSSSTCLEEGWRLSEAFAGCAQIRTICNAVTALFRPSKCP